MVRRILSFLARDVEGMHKAAYLLAFSAFFSQILGLVRDRLLAHTFGASTSLDIYYAAFKVQDFIYFAIASLVSISILVPFLSEKIESNGESLKKFVNGLFTVFFGSIALASLVTYVFVPEIVSWLFPGLVAQGALPELSSLTRILLLSPLILGVSNLLASITQVYGKFFIYAFAPILYNVGIIIGIIFFFPVWGMPGLAYGVIVGALLHLLIQVPFIASLSLLPRFSLRPNLKEVGGIVRLSVPRMLALSANHIALLVLISFASMVGEGAISVLSFSINLQSVALSIIGASYSVAVFPTLARHFSRGEKEAFFEQLVSASRHIIFWSCIALVLFVVLRAHIVRVVLGSGAFDWDATRLTAACLALFVVSIVAQNLSLLFVRAYYASGSTSRPFWINLFSAAVTIVFAYVGFTALPSLPTLQYFLESLLRVEDIAGSSILVLPLAFSIGAVFNTACYWYLIAREHPGFSRRIFGTLFQSFAASVVAGFFTYKILEYFGTVFLVETFWEVFLQGLLAGCVGIGAALALLLFLNNRELNETIDSLRTRLSKEQVLIAPDESDR